MFEPGVQAPGCGVLCGLNSPEMQPVGPDVALSGICEVGLDVLGCSRRDSLGEKGGKQEGEALGIWEVAQRGHWAVGRVGLVALPWLSENGDMGLLEFLRAMSPMKTGLALTALDL